MMKKTLISIVCMLALVMFYGCKKPGCFQKAGPVISESHNLPGFSKLILMDNISVELIQSNEEKMELQGAENILPNIIATVLDNTLTISNVGECGWLRSPDEKIFVKLYFKNLTNIDYRASGNITNKDTLKLDYLNIESNIGAGDIILTLNNRYTGSYLFKENAGIFLHGKSQECYTYTNARAIADMRDFVVKRMVIEYGGLADTYINVTDELDAIVFYQGNIYYKGNPTVTRSQYYSTGRLIRTP